MTITQDIKQELTRIQALQAPARLEIDAPSGRIESQIAACDAIGCSFETLTLRAPKLAAATIDQLKKLSDKLTSKLTYLLEPIGALEADAESCTVQLRSSPPQKDDDGSSYYELLVKRGAKLDVKDKEGRTPLRWAEGVFLASVGAERKPATIALLERLIAESQKSTSAEAAVDRK